MKMVLLGAAAVALMGMAPSTQPTGMMVTSVGGSAAESCYNAANARDASRQAFAECNSAISEQVIPYNDLVATHVNRGVLLLVRGDYGAAETDFDRAIALNALQPEAYLNKGIARYQQGDARSAAALFDKAIQLRTRYAALAYFGRALASEDTGNIKGAYADLRRASELNPKWDAPRAELARFQVR